MLVDYGSPSPEPQRPAALPPVLDDDVDESYDPADAFGLAHAAEPVVAAAAPRAEQLIASAPEVLLLGDAGGHGSSSLVTRTSDAIIFFNSTYADMSRPVEGPQNPWSDRKLEKMNTITGHVEQQAYSDLSFKEQQRSFDVLGYAANPSILTGDHAGPGLVGDLEQAFRNNGELIGERKVSRAVMRETKRKRKGKGTVGEFDDEEEEEEEPVLAEGEVAVPRVKKEKVQKEYIGPWAGWENEVIAPVAPTVEMWEDQIAAGGAPLTKKQRTKAVVESGKREVGFGEEKSVFHGVDLHDYLGRSYLHIPNDVDVNLQPQSPGEQECFQPKKCIHTWSGHTKGVQKIELFPKSGHLLLSASMDHRIKLWDIYHEGKCLRTFMGHAGAVRDVNFNSDGTKFLSASFDRQMKLWDTETGQCLQAFSNGKIPYCIKFHPEKPNIFLAGMSDKKIVQYDIGSGEIVQEYDQHLGPVNTINFVDENRRFVTTSDDKTVRVWDYDIPVVIKYIAEPTMHSMPAVGKDPTGKWLAMQSLDNQILIFNAESFKQNRKKRFAGHTIAGYACEPQFSPDGRFLSSGDGSGNMVFWDWKTCRIASRLKAHNQVVISHAWLPHETSKVVTSSWDGLIKLWD